MNQAREEGFKKIYINRPRENQKWRQCYAVQIAIKANIHFIVEVEEVEHYGVGIIAS